jgi:hypothetical protein
VLAINAAEQEKHRQSLSPEQKAHVLAINAAKHIKHRKTLTEEETKIADQIKRYADTLTTAIDLDQATIEFL